MDKKLEFYTQLNSSYTILYVEDDPSLRLQTLNQLNPIIPNIISAANGQEGLDIYKKYFDSKELNTIKLIITDIEMPHQNGLDMIRKIKEISPCIPIIIVSAHNHTEYFLKAIEIGVDGYILKPYTIQEIIAILDKTIKKQYQEENKTNILLNDKNHNQGNNILDIGINSYYNLSTEQLFYKNNPIKLSEKENNLLKILINAKGKSVSYKTIEYMVWPHNSIHSDALRSLIYRLRTKIEPNLIETIPSFGYKLNYPQPDLVVV